MSDAVEGDLQLDATGARGLLERELEVSAITEIVRTAMAGQGALAVVEGAPGLGKTRLLGVAREIAERENLQVLAAQATELESELPFGAVRQLLGARSVQRASPLQDGADRSLAMIEQLRAELWDRLFPEVDSPDGAPALLLIDDAQWADGPSLRFLLHVSLRIEELPVAIIVATRSAEPGAPQDLLDALVRTASRVVTPKPLSSDGIGLLARASLGDRVDGDLIAAAARATGGNPFYLSELLRLLASPGSRTSIAAIQEAAPASVMRAVLGRLARLGAAPAELATAIAVLGDGCALDVARELAGLTALEAEEAADQLARAGLIAPGEPLRFAHPLISSSLRADLGAFALARLHRRAAEILACTGGEIDRIAAHLVNTRPQGDPETVSRLRRAARNARSRGEPQTARKLLTRALEEPPPRGSCADVLIELADAEVLLGSSGADGHLQAALEATADPRRRAEICAALARTLHATGHISRAAEVADQALRELSPEDPLIENVLAAWGAPATLLPALHERLDAKLAPLIAAARASRYPDDPALCALMAAWMLVQGEAGATVVALAEAAFAQGPLVDGEPSGVTVGFAAAALVGADALEPAQRLLTAAIDAAGELGAALAGAIARRFRAIVNYRQGRLAEAVTDAEYALEPFRYGWISSTWSCAILAVSHLERGDMPAAEEALGTPATNEALSEEVDLLEARALIRLAQQRPSEALAAAKEAGRVVEQVHRLPHSLLPDWMRLAAVAAHAAGCGAEAADLAARNLERARAGAPAARLGSALAAAGIVAGGEEGLDQLRAAVEIFERLPPRLDHVRALLELGGALRRRGRRSEARDRLYEALEMADGFGAARLVALSRAELAALGLRPRRAARAGVAGLTPAERRVAELAAAGLSNPRIAHALHITRKTVESHLAQVYRKLEVDGRGELQPALGETPASDLDSRASVAS
jgi:DNA-binding CsgD family transcriptional regulator